MGVNTDGTAYSCTVGTPRGTTYLYFEDFELEVGGATIEHTGQLILILFENRQKLIKEIYGNEKRRLPSNEARASGNYKFLSSDGFNHELAQISVIARSLKTDL